MGNWFKLIRFKLLPDENGSSNVGLEIKLS